MDMTQSLIMVCLLLSPSNGFRSAPINTQLNQGINHNRGSAHPATKHAK